MMNELLHLKDIKLEPARKSVANDAPSISKDNIKATPNRVITKDDLKDIDSDDTNSKFDSNSISSGDSDSASDSDTEMRIGDDFQAEVPAFRPYEKVENSTNSMLLWTPTDVVTENQIDGYLQIAKDKYNYTAEQALGMLQWHDHVVDKALQDLSNFSPFPEEWSTEDKILFEQAFNFHGKSFHRIRQMVPDKSHATLVRYYYSWKKEKCRTSVIDKHARRQLSKKEGGYDSDITSRGSNDNESKHINGLPYLRATQRRNGLAASALSNEMGDRLNPIGSKDSRANRKPPKGMYLDRDDLTAMSTGPMGTAEAILNEVDKEYKDLLQTVQEKKKALSDEKNNLIDTKIGEIRQSMKTQKIVPKWSQDDLLLAVQGVREYGKDFDAIAEMLGNKTESHIRSFYVSYRRRFNLDSVLKEYEGNHPVEVQPPPAAGGENGSKIEGVDAVASTSGTAAAASTFKSGASTSKSGTPKATASTSKAAASTSKASVSTPKASVSTPKTPVPTHNAPVATPKTPVPPVVMEFESEPKKPKLDKDVDVNVAKMEVD